MLCVSLFLFRSCSVVMYLKRQILRGLDLSILFSEARIGNMTLKNRFVRSATWGKYGNGRRSHDREALRHL